MEKPWQRIRRLHYQYCFVVTMYQDPPGTIETGVDGPLLGSKEGRWRV